MWYFPGLIVHETICKGRALFLNYDTRHLLENYCTKLRYNDIITIHFDCLITPLIRRYRRKNHTETKTGVRLVWVGPIQLGDYSFHELLEIQFVIN